MTRFDAAGPAPAQRIPRPTRGSRRAGASPSAHEEAS